MVMRRSVNAVRYAALVGMMAAILECGKLTLAALPNIEVVSLFIALFSYSFGWAGVLSAFVFVCIEPLIWGFGAWFVSYLIYWPALALVFLFLGKGRVRNRFVITAVIALTTFLFGILTSLVDIGLFSGSFDRFFYRFGIYYARGVAFYIVHIVSNSLVFIFLFPTLRTLLKKIKSTVFK